MAGPCLPGCSVYRTMAFRGRQLHKLACAILCLCSSNLPAMAAAPDIESLLDQHRTSLGLIHTLSCGIEVSGYSRVHSARYYRSGEDVYIKETYEKRVAETLVKGGTVRAISTLTDASYGGISAGGIRADDGKKISQCDVAARAALLTIAEPNGNRYVPFAQLVTEAARVGAPREAALDGKPVVAVDLVLNRPGILSNTWKVTVYFDPGANWMIVGTDHSVDLTKERRLLRLNRIREMREVKPGLFFPVKIEQSDEEKMTVPLNRNGSRPLPTSASMTRFPNRHLRCVTNTGCPYRITS